MSNSTSEPNGTGDSYPRAQPDATGVDPPPREGNADTSPDDGVDEAGRESFPASDPPASNAGRQSDAIDDARVDAGAVITWVGSRTSRLDLKQSTGVATLGAKKWSNRGVRLVRRMIMASGRE